MFPPAMNLNTVLTRKRTEVGLVLTITFDTVGLNHTRQLANTIRVIH